jgi:hypothetical protein
MNQITYHIQGLPTSHSAVLRSMVLLTEKSLDCNWQASADRSADVLFLGEAANADDFYPRPGQILISVGNSPDKQSLHLDLPLLFPRVAKLLASVTQEALHEQALRPMGASDLQPSVFNLGLLTPSAAHDDIPASGQLYKLKTWPPAGVIGTNRSYMRAAAVLTGKSLTSSQLAEKTSLPLGDCRQFIGKLGDSQCLDITAPGSAPSAPGLAPTASRKIPPLTAANAHTPFTPSNAAPSSSLFTRIRSRLGFLGKTAT